MLVMVKQDCAHLVFHRNDGFRETALIPGLLRALLAFNGVSVDIIA